MFTLTSSMFALWESINWILLSAIHGFFRIFHIIYSFVLVMDIICIGNITSHLSHNVHPILHVYWYSVSDRWITSFPVCNSICFYVPSSIHLVLFVSEYKLNPNPIWIYVPPFIPSIKASFIFCVLFDFRIVTTENGIVLRHAYYIVHTGFMGPYVTIYKFYQ